MVFVGVMGDVNDVKLPGWRGRWPGYGGGCHPLPPLNPTLTSFRRLPVPGWRSVLRWLVLLALAALYLTAHLKVGGAMAGQTNHDPARSDQANNMKCARSAAERAKPEAQEGISRTVSDWLPHYTDGVVNPLWPRVAAGFIDGMDDTRFFEYGKRWNVMFTGIFLAGCALLLGLRWSVPAVAIFLLAAGLGAFLPRAPWFQPEPIYYACFFLSWITGASLLRRNPIWLYAMFGLWTGLAYLAKASVQPLMLVFVGVTTLRFLAAMWPAYRNPDGTESRSPWSASSHFIGLSVMLCMHLVVIAPRLAYAQRTFGSPLHAYPSYWMWMDDFEEGYAWMGKHNTREALEAVPKAERPSFGNWLAKHDKLTAWQRLSDGTWWQVRRLLASSPTPRDKHGQPKKPWVAPLEHPGWTLTAMLAVTGLAAAYAFSLRRKEKLPIHRQEPERGMVMLYTLGAFALYSMLHGWYTQVGDGDRFMLALWAPLVFSVVGAGESIMARLEARKVAAIVPWTYRTAQCLIIAWMAWRLLELWKLPNFA